MALLTLSQIRTAVRNREDYSNSRVFTTAILNDYINSALAELYGTIIGVDEDYYTVLLNTTTQAGVHKADLPAEFYKLNGVDRLVDGALPSTPTDVTDATYLPLKRVPLSERNRYPGRGRPIGYRLQERQESGEPRLWLYPIPDAVYYLRLFYTPVFTPLVDDDETSTFDMWNGYEELPVQMTLLRCYLREERPTGEIEREIARLMERIRNEADGRDTSEPPYLTDHRRGPDFDDVEWWP